MYAKNSSSGSEESDNLDGSVPVSVKAAAPVAPGDVVTAIAALRRPLTRNS